MKTNWQTIKLDEVCDFQRGLTYSKKDEVDFSNNIVLRSNNIDLKNNLLNLDELRYIDSKIIIPESKKVKKGSIIICTANGSRSHLGKVALIDKDYGYAFGGFMGQLIPKNIINSKYFFYILTSDLYKKQLAKISSGANINNLKFSDLSELEIPFPPLPEQHRIVKILDEVFEKVTKAKENTEKNLQNAQDLFESYLKNVFKNLSDEWEEKKLGDKNLFKIIDGDRGKNYPNKSDFSNDGYCLFLNTKNVRPNGFDFRTTMFVSEKKDNELGNGKLLRNDVLLTTRGTIGNIAVYDKNVPFENIRINSGMLIFRSNIKLIIPEYLFVIFQSGIMKTQIKKYVSGAAQPQLPIKTLVNFSIPVPKSISEQKSIVAKLDALSVETKKLEAVYKQKLSDLEELKKSVLKKAFEGEL